MHPILLWFIVWLPVIISGLRVQFFLRENYSGFLFEIGTFKTAAGECIEIPAPHRSLYGIYGGGSLKTDTCIIAYSSRGCTGSSSVKYLPEGPAESMVSPDVLPALRTRSIYVCDNKNGGSQLNVDIYRFINYQDSVAASFIDICFCRNLPWDWQRPHMSVDNRGNSMMVYSEENCTGRSKYIPAGRNPFSENIHWEYDIDHVVKSIGPSHNATYFKLHCVRLSASIFKLEFFKSAVNNATWDSKSNVEFGAQTTFRNNGSAKLSQEYSVRKKVREAVEIEVGQSVRKLHSVSVEPSLDIIGSAQVPFLAKLQVDVGLKTAVEYTRERTNLDSSKTTVENEKEFLVRQNIEVMPCTEYTVNAFVEMVKTKPVFYKAYAKITGILGNKYMSAKEVRMYMEGRGLTYVKDFDDKTLIASMKGNVQAEYGVKSVFVGNGRKIADCTQICPG